MKNLNLIQAQELINNSKNLINPVKRFHSSNQVRKSFCSLTFDNKNGGKEISYTISKDTYNKILV